MTAGGKHRALSALLLAGAVAALLAPVGIASAAPPPGQVHGHVSGSGATTATVFAKVAPWYWEPVAEAAITGGQYTVTGVPAGTGYRLVIGASGSVLSQFWLGEYWEDAAALLDVAPGGTTEADAALMNGAVLSGTVRDGDGAPVEDGVGVYLDRREPDGSWAEALAPADRTVGGAWSAFGVAPGQYRVRFVDDMYWTYLPGSAEAPGFPGTPRTVLVDGAGQGGLDGALQRAGVLTGSIASPDGVTDPSGVYVDALRVVGDGSYEWTSWGETVADGTYWVGGLRPGSYVVYFSDPAGASWYRTPFAPSYYKNVAVDGTPDTVAVTSDPVALDEVAMAWSSAIHIEMTTPEGGAPDVAAAHLYRRRAADGAWLPYAYDPSAETYDGAFAFDGLPAGDYRVAAIDLAQDLGTRWWKDAADLAGADTIALGTDELATAAIAFDRDLSTVSGVLRDVAGDPAPGVPVTCWRDDGSGWVFIPSGVATSAADGSWSATVPDGEYRIDAGGAGTGFLRTYYADTTAWDDATTVTVGPGSPAGALEMTLPPAVRLEGTLTTGSADDPLPGGYVAAYIEDAGVPAGWTLAGDAISGPTGRYAIESLPVGDLPGDGLRPGRYRLEITEPGLDPAQWLHSGTGPWEPEIVDATTVLDHLALDMRVVRDEQPPATSAGVPSGWATGTATVSFDATDGQSGARATYWRAGAAGYYRPTYGETIQIAAEGTTTLHFFSVDQWENREADCTATVRIDRGAPSAPGLPEAPWANVATGDTEATVTVEFSPAADAVSGVAGYLYSIDDTAGAAPDTFLPADATSVTGRFPAGAWHLVMVAVDAAGNRSPESRAVIDVRPAVTSATVTRFPGADRWDTASRIAQAFPGWPGAVHHVVIACGDDRAMADPLSAAGLAGVYHAPVMIAPSRLAKNGPKLGVLAARLSELPGPTYIHVVGGPAALPDAVYKELARYRKGGTIERFNGANRYNTAELVAKRIVAVQAAKGTPVDGYLVANGAGTLGYYDALALAPIAYAKHWPLLLTRAGDAPGETVRQLDGFDRSKVWVAGGTANVSARAMAMMWVSEANRIAGADPVTTAIAVAEKAGAKTWAGPRSVAIGSSLADALPGGALIGAKGGLMLYTSPTALSAPTRSFLETNRTAIADAWILGGTKAVGASVETDVLEILPHAH